MSAHLSQEREYIIFPKNKNLANNLPLIFSLTLNISYILTFQLIYFPDKWWHATLNIDTSVFISTFLSP